MKYLLREQQLKLESLERVVSEKEQLKAALERETTKAASLTNQLESSGSEVWSLRQQLQSASKQYNKAQRALKKLKLDNTNLETQLQQAQSSIVNLHDVLWVSKICAFIPAVLFLLTFLQTSTEAVIEHANKCKAALQTCVSQPYIGSLPKIPPHEGPGDIDQSGMPIF